MKGYHPGDVVGSFESYEDDVDDIDDLKMMMRTT